MPFGYFLMRDLENQPTNIEIQLMNRFIRDNNSYAIQTPNMYRDELNDLCTFQPRLTGSVLATTHASTSMNDVSIAFPSSCTRHVFGEAEIDILSSADSR